MNGIALVKKPTVARVSDKNGRVEQAFYVCIQEEPSLFRLSSYTNPGGGNENGPFQNR